MMRDRFEQELSVRSATALGHYDTAVDAYLHAWTGGLDRIEAAIAAEPGFALAHALKALMLNGRGQGALARSAIGIARDTGSATLGREQSQIEIITAIVAGRPVDALAQVLSHARRFPADPVAASTALGAYGLFAFCGSATHDADRLVFTEALAPHFPTDFPWLLAYRGWARIEAGQVQEGLAMARRAIELRPQNAHNAHIVMHGLYESDASEEALAFAKAWLPDYPDMALMWGHLHWHAALAEIALGRADHALARLLGPIVDYLPKGTPFMGLADIVSLLWRLRLQGVAPLPWNVAQDHAAEHFATGSNVFGELHLSMLAAARGDQDGLMACRQRVAGMADRGHQGAPVMLRWTDALVAMLAGDTGAAREALAQCAAESVRLGGSHAQRGVVGLTLDAAHAPVVAT